MIRMQRDLWLKYHFAGLVLSDECNRKIYVKLTWQPSPGSFEFEEAINAFERQIILERDTIEPGQCT